MLTTACCAPHTLLVLSSPLQYSCLCHFFRAVSLHPLPVLHNWCQVLGTSILGGWRTCPWPAPLPRNVCGLNSCRSQVSCIWGRPGALGNDATRFCSSARKRVLAVDTQRIFPWKDWLVLLCGKPGPPLPSASGASYKMAQVTQTAVTALKCGVFRAWHDRDAVSRLN